MDEEIFDDTDFLTLAGTRENRNILLKESDKYLLPDYPILESNVILIKEYRQTLRDYMNLPEVINYKSSNNIPLPPLPTFPF